MITLREQLEDFEPNDSHERNEQCQLLTMVYGLEEGNPLPTKDIIKIRQRTEALLRHEKHPDRVDAVDIPYFI